MPATPADRLMQFNQQAIAILRLGIPLDLGLTSGVESELQEINHRLIIQSDASLSSEELLSRLELPERYQAIAGIVLSTQDWAPVFESLYLQDHEQELAAVPLRQAFLQPAVVACLVYIGLIFLCVFTVDRLESQIEQLGQQPDRAIAMLITLRDTLPFWAVGFPIVLAGVYVFWNRIAKRMVFQMLPRGRAYSKWLAAESQSRRLASMVESGFDDDTALVMASGSVSPRLPVRPIAEQIVRRGEGRTDAESLHRLANLYGFMARDLRQTVLSRTPMLIGVAVAAMIVLVFALATFVPWVELLNVISTTRGT